MISLQNENVMSPCVQLFATPWTVTLQAPLSMGFSRQEYWSGLPFSSPGDLPDPGIKLKSPALAGRFFTTEIPSKPHGQCHSKELHKLPEYRKDTPNSAI